METDDDADAARPFATVGRDPADEATARVDVDAALRRLAPEHRVAVVLRDVCDLTYEEIATVLDVPVGTVRSRIARGRGALADLMTRDSGATGDSGDSGDTAATGDTGDHWGRGAGNRPGPRNVKTGDRTEDRTP